MTPGHRLLDGLEMAAFKCRVKRVLPLLALALAACMHLKTRDPSVYIPPKRLAGFRPFVTSFLIDGKGRKVEQPERESDAEDSLDESINYRLSTKGGLYPDPAALPRLEQYVSVRTWAKQALEEIVNEEFAQRDGRKPRHLAVHEWSYPGGSLRSWRTILGADFLLVSLFLDGAKTTGLWVAEGITGWTLIPGYPYGEGVACVVDLEDGRIVWCDFVNTKTLEMRTRQGAQTAVDRVTASLFAMSPSAPPP
jgi:hypothetical protein